MYTAQPQTVVYVKERRSLCARLFAFLLTLVSGFVIVVMFLSLAIFLVAPQEALEKYFKDVDMAAQGLAREIQGEVEGTGTVYPKEISSIPRTSTSFPDMPLDAPTPLSMPPQTERWVSVFTVSRRVAPRVIVMGAIATVLVISAAVTFLLFVDREALLTQLIAAKDATLNGASQVFSEVQTGVSTVYQNVINFDFAGLWNNILSFLQQVWAEFKDLVVGFFNKLFAKSSETTESYDVIASLEGEGLENLVQKDVA